MAQNFRYIVIGCGMMGAAAARHLSSEADGIAMIGPAEPSDSKRHQGVFASHYDEARITRTIDPDPVWARLANRSIARYREIEAESGIRFYHESGCLMVAPARSTGHPYIKGICAAAETLGVDTELLSDEALSARYPCFGFEAKCEGVVEVRHAGHINPRALVAAQSLLAERQGARRIAETVVSVRDEEGCAVVRTAEGGTYRAEKAIVAAGGFSIAENLLAQSLRMSVYARTVTFFEIPEDSLDRFAGMPSLIYEPRDPSRHIYILPPVRYPDGKVYLKIGGDPDDILLEADAQMRAWFRSGGRASVRDHHAAMMRHLVPAVADLPVSMGACVVAKTPTGYPVIANTASDRIALVTGGCGTAAKSSDEIGRLGAELLLKGRIEDGAFPVAFSASFA